MLRKVNHIGIAVKSIDDAKKLYELMGLKVEGYEVVKEQKVKVAFIQVGETRIELLEATSEDSPVAKFIEKRGEGIHHIAFEVDDIEKALQVLKENGIRLIDEKPRRGAHNTKIAFVHPKSTNGVLMEICQEG
jgi:methylmalonyl-CoA epimerase